MKPQMKQPVSAGRQHIRVAAEAMAQRATWQPHCSTACSLLLQRFCRSDVVAALSCLGAVFLQHLLLLLLRLLLMTCGCCWLCCHGIQAVGIPLQLFQVSLQGAVLQVLQLHTVVAGSISSSLTAS